MSTVALFCTIHIPVEVRKDATVGELDKAIKEQIASQDFTLWKVNMIDDRDKNILQLNFDEARSVEKIYTIAGESFEHMHLVIEPPGFTGTSQEVLKIREPTVVRNQIEVDKNESVPLANSHSLIMPFVCKFTQDGQDCV